MRALVRFASAALLLFVLYTLAFASPRLAAPAQVAEVSRARERAAPLPLQHPRPPKRGEEDAPALYTYRVVNSYPHDRTCFTQGLVVRAPPLDRLRSRLATLLAPLPLALACDLRRGWR